MKKYLPILFLLCIVFTIDGYSQNGSVGIGTNNPHPSSSLHVYGQEKGLLIPRMTNTSLENIASPATGLLVFDKDLNGFVYFNGSEWLPLKNSTVYTDTTITGIGTSSRPLSLAQQGANNSQVLKWNGIRWAPAQDSTISNLWQENQNSICYEENVGIGTCQPKQKLHINSDTSDVGFRFSSSSHDYIAILDETEGTLTFTPDSVTGTSSLALSEQGKVGIGTTNPRDRLHINSDSGNLYTRYSSSSHDYIAILDETEGTLAFGQDTGTTSTSVDEHLVMDSTGKVGIGKTDTAAKLNVEGAVKASKLKIENNQGEQYSISADSTGSPMWHESIIDLYESSNYSVQTSYTDFSWDEQRFTPGKAFDHSIGDAVIEVNTEGYYRVTYNISINNPSGSSGESYARLLIDQGSGFANLPGSHAYASHFSSSNPKINSLGGNIILKFNPGDRIKLQLKASISGMETLPEGCRINIKKVAY